MHVQYGSSWDGSRRLLVANHGSHAINVLAVDPASGKLAPGESWLPINQPANVTFR